MNKDSKYFDVIKAFTINPKEKCIKCSKEVNGDLGFVLVRADIQQRNTTWVVRRQIPICLKCWDYFNWEIKGDKRDGTKIIEKRIKKTIIKRLKK